MRRSETPQSLAERLQAGAKALAGGDHAYVDDDREWFQARSRRKYRVRLAAPAEIVMFDGQPPPECKHAVLVEKLSENMRLRMPFFLFPDVDPDALGDAQLERQARYLKV